MPPTRSQRAKTGEEGRGHVHVLLAEAGLDWRAMNVALGDAIRARRRSLGLTQQTLAERIGVSVPWVGMLECARGSPSLEMLTLFASGLETSPGELLAEAGAALSVKPRVRSALSELHAALAQLPPDSAVAVCEAVVALCGAIRPQPAG